MAITPRTHVSVPVPVPTRTPARRQFVRLPPTQSQLSVAAYCLADRLARGSVSDEERDEAAAKFYEFAEQSVDTAWSLVDAAIIAMRCFQGRRKVAGTQQEVVAPFITELDKGKVDDLNRKREIETELKGKEIDEATKAELETELKELLLRGIPQGRPMRLGPQAGTFLLGGMAHYFLPVSGSPLAEQDLPNFVRNNVRFCDFIAMEILFSEEAKAEYQAKKEADKAARAEATANSEAEADADAEIEEVAEAAAS
ncbi:hypothetical protein HQ487_00110 [Candidatus Uhrbacteria bacterium]|nr:hypothetical protein [Candidatus Uhrbacteria bacterium]